MNIENTVFSHFVVYIIVIVYKQSLIRGGGQLLGNDDGVKIPSIYKSFQCIVHGIFKVFILYFLFFLFLIKRGKS